MNVIILSHKRSLNKTEGLITANLNNHITLVCDVVPNKSGDRYKPFIKHIDNLVVSKKFDIIGHFHSKIYQHTSTYSFIRKLESRMCHSLG